MIKRKSINNIYAVCKSGEWGGVKFKVKSYHPEGKYMAMLGCKMLIVYCIYILRNVKWCYKWRS